MRIPRRLRPALRTITPGKIRRWRGDRWRRDHAAATEKLWRLSQGWVLFGPFAGMRYLRTHYSMLGPKLLGTYEREIAPALDEVLGGGFQHVVNVGAGEGYFACGLLFRIPSLQVTAFETSEAARTQLLSLARRNGVADRLVVRGSCDRAELQAALEVSSQRRQWLLMDIEGGERRLLDPDRVPALRGATVVVETHEHLEAGVLSQLLRRFRPTHRTIRIPAVERSVSDLPEVKGMTGKELELAAFERSAEAQEWLWMPPLGPVDSRSTA